MTSDYQMFFKIFISKMIDSNVSVNKQDSTCTRTRIYVICGEFVYLCVWVCVCCVCVTMSVQSNERYCAHAYKDNKKTKTEATSNCNSRVCLYTKSILTIEEIHKTTKQSNRVNSLRSDEWICVNHQSNQQHFFVLLCI